LKRNHLATLAEKDAGNAGFLGKGHVFIESGDMSAVVALREIVWTPRLPPPIHLLLQISTKVHILCLLEAGLPDGLFSNQKAKFG
jgi:hypothetical protein